MKKKQAITKLFKTVLKYSKKEILLNSIAAFISGTGGALNIVFLGFFYKILENSSGLSENTVFFSCLLCIAITLAVYLVISVAEDFYNNVIKPKMRLSSTQRMEVDLFNKAKKIDLKEFDDEEFYNTASWVMNNYVSNVFAVLDQMMSTVSFGITLVTSSIILAFISPVIGITIILACFIGALIDFKRGKLTESFDEQMLFINRKEEYLEGIFTDKSCAKELRCSSIINLIIKKYDEVLQEKKNKTIKHNKKMLYYNYIGDLFQYLTKPLVYVYLFYSIIVTKTIGIGSLAVTFATILRFNHIFEQIFGIIVSLSNNIEYCKKVFVFLDRADNISDGTMQLKSLDSLETRGLSFSYVPKMKVLDGVDLSIKKGEKIAIVGSNGAGKTTLIKLLLRLYKQDSGKILLNDLEIEEYSSDSLNEKIGTVFQDFSIYALPVSENVLMDRSHNSMLGRIQAAIDETTLRSKIDSLPDGIETVLSKEYGDGVDLSGGERQKIALSRVLVRDYDLIIMDEPSSELDAKAEYEFNNNILTKMSKETVILISHRLSTTRFVDRIIVIENGKVVENGTHDELIKKRGRYYDLFTLQSQYYVLT